MQPCEALQGRQTGSGSRSLSRLISAVLLAKLISVLNGRRQVRAQLSGLQPRDRQHDSSGQEHGECTMFLSVCLRREKPQWSCYPVSSQQSDFSTCLASEGHPQPHKHPHAHPQSEDSPPEFVCRAFCLSLDELKYAMLCVCVSVSVHVRGKQQGMASSDR